MSTRAFERRARADRKHRTPTGRVRRAADQVRRRDLSPYASAAGTLGTELVRSTAAGLAGVGAGLGEFATGGNFWEGATGGYTAADEALPRYATPEGVEVLQDAMAQLEAVKEQYVPEWAQDLSSKLGTAVLEGTGDPGAAALAEAGLDVVGLDRLVRLPKDLTGAARAGAEDLAAATTAGLPAISRRELRRVRGGRSIEPYLTPEEIEALPSPDAAARTVAATRFGNRPEELAAAALAGGAKKGWYAQSEQALRQLFANPEKPDDPARFIGVLASTSPQTSVQENMKNALKLWREWTQSGRPKDEGKIRELMERAWGKKAAENMDAWVNNSLRTLLSDDAREVMLSGPKVDAFRRALLGDLSDAVNDAWMARMGAGDQSVMFDTTDLVSNRDWMGNVGTAGPGYLAQVIKTRQAADMLGSDWEAGNVQEAGWSLSKTLADLAEEPKSVRKALREFGIEIPDYIMKARPGTTARALLESGNLEDTPIVVTPAFGDLLKMPAYAGELAGTPYESRIPDLPTYTRATSSPYERLGVAPEDLSRDPSGRALLQVAENLDAVADYRRRLSELGAAAKRPPLTGSSVVYGGYYGKNQRPISTVITPGAPTREQADRIAELEALRQMYPLMPEVQIKGLPAAGGRAILDLYQDPARFLP